MEVKDAIAAITEWLEIEDLGKPAVNYKLRDWVFSRQRYWGEPIPLIHCDDCGWVPVADEELPLELPELESFQPSEEGQSPLLNAEEWINVPCPKCGKPGKRQAGEQGGRATGAQALNSIVVEIIRN